MSAILLDPHGDDAVLFACYTLLREKPHVVVTHRTVPREEIGAAMDVLGCSWSEGKTLWEEADLIIGPHFESEGIDDHNAVAGFVAQLYGVPKIAYLTYAPRGHRSREGSEVLPPAGGVALKLRALSCFESQIEQRSTRPWFYDLLDMREWRSHECC